MSGLDFIRTAKKAASRNELLVHTTFADRNTLVPALLVGASGYFLKGERLHEMAGVLRILDSGGANMADQRTSQTV